LTNWRIHSWGETIVTSSDWRDIALSLVAKSYDIDVRVYGGASGHIEFRRIGWEYAKVYVNFSNGGDQIWSGRETRRANPDGNSTYTANVRLAGSRPGAMDLQMIFGSLGGNLPPRSFSILVLMGNR